MTSDTKITLRENGPLVVKSPPLLSDAAGGAIETKPVVALCRCGQSKNKPFCDGSHSDAGFSSAPDHRKIRNAEIRYAGKVEGRDVTIAYTPVLCSHAAECQRLALAVFDPTRKPWIEPGNGSLDEILAVIAACPSGALRVSVDKEEDRHLTTPEVEIAVEKHGPYHVKNVPLEAEFNGVGASTDKYVLCRCGLSKNKPFCDGSHYEQGWRDNG